MTARSAWQHRPAGAQAPGRGRIGRRALLRMVPAVAGALVATRAFAQTPRRGGTLRIQFSAIRQLDPYKTSGNNSEDNASSLVFDALVYLGRNFEPRPLLAERWETPNSTTWVFRLRRNVMFQDDNPVFPKGSAREVTAEDVVYSVNRFLKVSNAFTLGTVDSVRAVDRYTVELKKPSPDPFLLSDPNRMARVMIVPHEAIEKLGEDGFARQPVGSGPFKLRSFTANQTVVFDRNPSYWMPVYPDHVEFTYIPDPTVATIALQGGRIDVLPYVANVDAVRQLSGDPNLRLASRGGSFRGLGFNVKTPPFNELPVRDALAKAMDIDSAVRSVIAPYGERAYGQVPPWVPFGYDPSLKALWRYDPHAALDELAKAGFTEKNRDGILERNGTPLSFKIKVIAGAQVRVLTILVTQLRQMGIDAQIQQQDVAVWASDLIKGNETGVFFDFSYAGTTGLYELFGSANIGKSNTHFYANPKVDALFTAALVEPDAARRSSLWKQAQRLIMEDRVVIPLYFERQYSAMNKRVVDWVVPWAPLRLESPENNVYLTS